jgi:putative component of membrane protein insertase Oxa1/YidC/SpoIIIJ protein YidD
MVWAVEQVIRFHQEIISPVDGPRSHFRPSSSQYMLQAVQKHGSLQGFIMGCDRLLRENSDAWVYRTTEYNGALYKWDPPP